MNKILIHIGYHKTGTTWLQQRLFVTSKLGFTRALTKTDITVPLIMPHALDFDAVACRACFEPSLRAAWMDGLLPVISHERLSGEVHTGGRDAKDTADRLHAVFPEATIFLVIREQQAMIRSIYGQFIKGTGVWPLHEYLDPPVLERTRLKYGHFHPDQFRYHRLIAYYQHLYGPKQVIVLPYELFRRRPAVFVSGLLTAVGLPVGANALAALPYDETVNPSLSAMGIAVKRLLNRVAGQRTAFNTTPLLPSRNDKQTMSLQAWAFWIDRRLPMRWKQVANERMKRQIANRFDGYYAESNRQTAALTGLDLAAWGYGVA